MFRRISTKQKFAELEDDGNDGFLREINVEKAACPFCFCIVKKQIISYT